MWTHDRAERRLPRSTQDPTHRARKPITKLERRDDGQDIGDQDDNLLV